MRELLDYLIKEVENEVSNVRVRDIRIGVAYTGVLLSNGYAGVAYTPVQELSGCPTLENAGNIADNSALKIAEMALSSNLIEAAVGVATVNALSQVAFEIHPEKYIFSDVDVLDLIESGDRVFMIGYIGPLISKIFEKTRDLIVTEKRMIINKDVRTVSQHEIPEALLSSDVILISGSTLVNKTINDILDGVGDAREVVLLGPTASMVPQPLFKKGVTAVMGIKITNPKKMLRIISEAGGTRQLLSTCAEKTALLKRNFP